MYLSVIIPAHNEEKRILKTLQVNREYLRHKSFEYEVLVVDNGSTDQTAKIVQEFQKEFSQVRVETIHTKGKGAAIRYGMLKTQGDIRLFMDADNATTLDHFDFMEPLFRIGLQVIYGTRDSRDHRQAKQVVSQPWHRRIMGDIGNLLIQALVLPGIWDTQAGFKACSKEAAEAIFSRAVIDGFGFDIEMLALAQRLRFKIGKIPLQWINDPESKVSFISYVYVFVEVFKIRWNLWTHKYKL